MERDGASVIVFYEPRSRYSTGNRRGQNSSGRKSLAGMILWMAVLIEGLQSRVQLWPVGRVKE